MRRGECCVEVAVGLFDERRLRRVERRHLCRQLLELEANQLGGVFRGVGILGENHGDRIANVAHELLGKHRLLVGLEAADARQANADRRQMPHVVVGPHRHDAGMAARLGRIDAQDLGVRHGRAHHAHMQLPGRLEVRGILAAPQKQHAIFEALRRGADVFHFARFFISAAAARTALTMFW